MATFLLKNIRTERKRWSESISDVTEVTSKTNMLVKDGIIDSFIDDLSQLPESINIIDGGNSLLVPALREMHCHIDKSKLGTEWTPVSKAPSIIERFTNEPGELNRLELSLIERASNLIELETSNGVDFFRTHIDVHTAVGGHYLEESLRAADHFSDQAEFEFVAFPQHGLLRSDSVGEVDAALKNGADLVGGVDPASVDGNYKDSLDATFNLAVKHNVDIDLHIHDRGYAFTDTLKYLLKLTEESGWKDRVTLSHAFGLNDLGDEENDIFQQMQQLGVAVISSVPLSGNIPPLETLKQKRIDVSIGCDNIYDSWSPYGSGDIREKLRRYGEVFNIKTHNEVTDMFPLITGKPLNYSHQHNASGVVPGHEASFLLVEASCIAEFIARPVKIKERFHKGKRLSLPVK